MLFPILAGSAVAALVVLAIARIARGRKPADLGTISEAWVAQHRASSYDPNR